MSVKESRHRRRPIFRQLAMVAFLLCAGVIVSPALLKAAGSLSFTRPVNDRITDHFKMREEHPETGQRNRPHRGTDYGTACGTRLSPPAGGQLECTTMGGYGGTANVYHECGVMERYAHLQNCDTSSGTMVTGGGRGMAGAGTSTGCHLHYEIWLDGISVDPEYAYGKNMCDPAVREDLIRDAQDKLNGLAGGGGGGHGPPAQEPGNGATSVTYVPSGGIDPITGIINPGPGYYLIVWEDGRITYEFEDQSSGDVPALPPTPPAELIPTTDNEAEVSGCATDTWTAMVNQAVLEARREQATNQTLISKQDSALAYACWTEQIEPVRHQAGPLFSESKRWVNVDFDLLGKTVTVDKELGEYSLDGAIVSAALNPYESYMRSYFQHDFIGGTEGMQHANHEGHAHIDDQAYTPCGAMSMIWKMAKCVGQDYEPFFYRFEDLVNMDPRKYPGGYDCNFTGITQDMIDIARGRDVKMDKAESYHDLLYPAQGECAPAIPSGITVTRMETRQAMSSPSCPSYAPGCAEPDTEAAERVAEQKEYQDGICLSAGCSFLLDGNNEGRCVAQ